jgi:hypothetical protein
MSRKPLLSALLMVVLGVSLTSPTDVCLAGGRSDVVKPSGEGRPRNRMPTLSDPCCPKILSGTPWYVPQSRFRGCAGSNPEVVATELRLALQDNQSDADRISHILELGCGSVLSPSQANLDKLASLLQTFFMEHILPADSSLPADLVGVLDITDTPKRMSKEICDSVRKELKEAGADEEKIDAFMKTLEQLMADQRESELKALVEMLHKMRGPGDPSLEDRRALRTILAKLSKSGVKPTSDALETLVADIVAVTEVAQMSRIAVADFARDLSRIVNSVALSDEEMAAMMSGIRERLEEYGVDVERINALVEHCMRLHQELRERREKNKASENTGGGATG